MPALPTCAPAELIQVKWEIPKWFMWHKARSAHAQLLPRTFQALLNTSAHTPKENEILKLTAHLLVCLAIVTKTYNIFLG